MASGEAQRARTPDAGENPHVPGLARGSAVAILGTVVNQGSLVLTVALIAATLGSSGLGVFSQAYAVLILVSLAALVGMQTSLTRYVAGFVASGDWAGIRPVVRFGMSVAVAVSVLLALLVAAVSSWLATDVLQEPDVATPLVLVALALPFAVYARLAGAVLQGHQRMGDFVVVTLIVEPAVRLVGVSVVLLAGGGIDAVAAVLVVSNVVAALWGWQRLRGTLVPVARREPMQVRPFLRFSSFTWVASLATTGLVWLDTLLLGIFRPSDEVGVYQVATRLVALATLGSVPIASAFAPRIARMIKRRDWGHLSEAYAAATTWSTRLSVPALALCLVIPGHLLALFGDQYRLAAAVTMILVVGKLVEAATGPCGMVLNMSSRVQMHAVNNVVALVLNIGLNLVLIPRYGLIGAAIAWSISLVVVNLARLVQVRLAFGLRLVEPAALMAIVAVIPGALLGWSAVALADGYVLELASATVAVLGGYVLVTRWLTWSETDRIVAATLRDALLPGRRRRAAAEELLEDTDADEDAAPTPAPAGSAATSRAKADAELARTPITRLISPLRYDVLIRADFFRLVEANRQLWDDDHRAFLALAYRHDYWIWFRCIASQLGLTSRQGVLQRRAFERRVARSVAMFDRFTAEGYDTRMPINLWYVGQVLPTATGKTLQRQVHMGDGCHRLALLHNAGVQVLGPEHVRWHHIPAFAPRDNTFALVRRAGVQEPELLRFLASGYGIEAGPADTVQSVAERLPAAEAAEFTAVAAIDLAAIREPARTREQTW